MNQSTKVLARKWRPKSFAEVVGQEHVLRVLVNALTQNRLHHAYIFTGTRGVGKTSIARILTKCLNCETGVTATPCGKCDSCREIDEGRFVDLIEVDAASRTKVEDTRDLLENVQYIPVKGRFKVYIIDEVHMLSGHSFNALLKTLEEPPSHVIFLFATTDVHKLPITVLSRCLQLNLKNVADDQILQRLGYILAEENIGFETEALVKLANAANGSIRDALSLLDQAIAYGDGKVQAADVSAMLGTIETTQIVQLLKALQSRNANLVLEIIKELAELAVDFGTVLEELLSALHKIAVWQLAGEGDPVFQIFAQQFAVEEIQLFYQIGLIGRRDLPFAPSSKTGFEMLMLRMLAFSLEGSGGGAVATGGNAASKQVSAISVKQDNILAAANNFDLLSKLRVTGTTAALIRHCNISALKDNIVELRLDPKQAALLNKKHEERLSAAFSELLNKKVAVNITLGVNSMETIASKEKEANDKHKAEALQSIKKDPNVKILMDKFDARIIEDSVE